MAYSHAKLMSIDLSTNNGAILVDESLLPMVFGTNTIPDDVVVSTERLQRPLKYIYTEHAERNCIYKAAKAGIRTEGLTLIVTWYACHDCARAIIASGIKRVVGHKAMMDLGSSRWDESIVHGMNMLEEAGVECLAYDGEVDTHGILFSGKVFAP